MEAVAYGRLSRRDDVDSLLAQLTASCGPAVAYAGVEAVYHRRHYDTAASLDAQSVRRVRDGGVVFQDGDSDTLADRAYNVRATQQVSGVTADQMSLRDGYTKLGAFTRRGHLFAYKNVCTVLVQQLATEDGAVLLDGWLVECRSRVVRSKNDIDTEIVPRLRQFIQRLPVQRVDHRVLRQRLQ